MEANVGTFRYMAPEVHGPPKDTAKYNKKADVFSAAMVLYSVFTGDRPMKKIVKDGIVGKMILSGCRPNVWMIHSKIRRTFERAWSTDPTNRPSFSELKEEIRGFDTSQLLGCQGKSMLGTLCCK